MPFTTVELGCSDLVLVFDLLIHNAMNGSVKMCRQHSLDENVQKWANINTSYLLSPEQAPEFVIVERSCLKLLLKHLNKRNQINLLVFENIRRKERLVFSNHFR